MEYKEHKKMYKAGKKWAVAALVSVSALTWGAVANADSSTTSADTNLNNSGALNTQYQANGTDGKTTDAANTTAPATANSKVMDINSSSVVLTTPAKDASAKTVKDAPTTPNDQKADGQKTAVATNKQGTTDTTPSVKVTINQPASQHQAQLNPASDTAKTTNQSAHLTDQAAAVVKNAGIDPDSLTAQQIKDLNQINFSKSAKSGTQMTYNDFKKIADTLIKQDGRYAVPFFNAKQIQNMPAAHTRDAQTGEVADMDIWDSWPVQDIKTGYVSNWNGYQLVIGMMGIPNTNDNHIYLLYNKYGDNNLADWKNAGPIFGFNATAVSQEWSGSATVNPDGSIQLFYTRVDTSDNNTNHQKLASATIFLNHNDQTGTVSINHVANDHIIFEGDGYYYQTYKQWRATNKGADNVAMRDAHVIEDNDGNRYLIFEASTGLENYQGLNQIYNWQNYGGSDKFNVDNFFHLLSNDDMRSRASWANAAIGILKLNDDIENPQVSELYTPLLTAPMVSDEIERPDVVKLGDKYYLFAATRLNRGSNDDAWHADDKAVGDNVVMVGYVSDKLTGGYKPLNDSGVVLTASVPANWRTATYSYYAVPVEGHPNQVLITSYITNRNEVAGKGMNSTWAPSFLLQINPDNTTMVLARMTNQGDWIWDNTSENDQMAGVLDKNAANSAALPGEWGKPIDWNLVGGYGLVPHEPGEPTTPSTPNVPNTPNTPNTPNVPNTPNTPNTPNVPNTPNTPNTPNVPNTPNKPNTELPQTGNQDSPAVMGLGFVSLLAMFGLASANKRRY